MIARNQCTELMDMVKKRAMEQFGKDLLQRLKKTDVAAYLNSITCLVNLVVE